MTYGMALFDNEHIRYASHPINLYATYLILNLHNPIVAQLAYITQ